ncbi:MAG: 30S ribosomal protein S17 [Gammaproteobacteria bacterium WSBS_2016_MAG_OTU1]
MNISLTADGAQQKVRRRLRGFVVGNSADKTARVRVERQLRHPLYEKIIRRHRDVQAHDADNACRIGELVVVEEMPRVSKTKGWRVVERPSADKEIA